MVRKITKHTLSFLILSLLFASAPILGAEATGQTETQPRLKKETAKSTPSQAGPTTGSKKDKDNPRPLRPILQDMEFTDGGWPVIRRIDRKWYEQEDRYAIGRRLLSIGTVCSYLKRTGDEPARHCAAAMDDHSIYQGIADFTYLTTWLSAFAFVGGVVFWAGGNSALAVYSGLTLATMLGVQIAISPWRESREENINKALDAYHKLPPPKESSGRGQGSLGLAIQIRHRF